MADSAGRPVAVIDTTALRVMRLGDVDLNHALGEGEGYTSVAEWRAAHEQFWHSAEVSPARRTHVPRREWCWPDIRLTTRRAGAMLTAVTGTDDHVRRNRAAWDRWAAEYAGPGLRNWAAPEPTWGIWNVTETQAGVLPSGLEGRDSIELGCGTGYVSAWLARRGARPAGLDNSAAQLATARQLQDRFELRFPLIHASAEQAPFADASFDLAISEYGASIWCDPYRWIPEAARLLRPGGQLIFLVNSALLMLTVPDADDQPATERLLRPYFGMHRFDWPDDESVEFHLGHGDMIRLLRNCGLEVEDLLELRPGPGATTRYPFVTLEWARQWPCEEVWKARKGP